MNAYGKINVWASYMPWFGDKDFLRLWKLIMGNNSTLLDIMRAWTLWQTARQMQYVDGDIIEVGCWRGGSGLLMRGGNVEGQTFLCDTFSGVVKASEMDSDYVGGEQDDASIKDVHDLFDSAELDVNILEGIFPDDTGDLVSGCKFKLAHIDVDVYRSAKDSFLFIWERMIRSGVVIFDDYGFNQTKGIREFVEKDLRRLGGCRQFYNLNGQWIIIKTF